MNNTIHVLIRNYTWSDPELVGYTRSLEEALKWVDCNPVYRSFTTLEEMPFSA